MCRLVLSLLVVLLTAGCAAIAPYTAQLLPGSTPPAQLQSQTEVQLRSGDFVIVRSNLQASKQGFKLLGLITIVPATVSEAMNRLYLKADIRPGKPQTLAHTMVEHSGVYLVLFSLPKVTARADLVEFIPEKPGQDTGALTSQRPPELR